MPESAPIVKQEATKAMELNSYCMAKASRMPSVMHTNAEGLTPLSMPDDEKIIRTGTIGPEIIEDLKDVDMILVPVGGGGLISGISAAVKSYRQKNRSYRYSDSPAVSAIIHSGEEDQRKHAGIYFC
jgi:threonine dehydratase